MFRQKPTKTVLAVVDQAFLLVVPFLVVSVALWRPSLVLLWTAVGLATMALIIGLARLGRDGRVPWRGGVYSIVTLVSAITALWTMGPITGVGVMFGLSISFASAFLGWRGLVAVILVAAGAVACRSFIGGSAGMHGVTDGDYHVSLSMWVGTAMASVLLLWTARRLLHALFAWLEESYTRAADSYAREAEMRREIARSRQELEELARVEMIGRLAGGVAHDINNALAAIMAAADVLGSDVSTPDQRRKLAELESASHYAADLVRDLLWTGRRFPMSTTAIANLETVMRTCMERIGRVSHRIAVDVQLAHRVELAMSPENLEQIVFGLVIGAERSGVTKLSLTTVAQEQRIALVFEMIEREASATGSRSMQARLAVSAARELVAQYGGTVVTRDDDFTHTSLDLPVAPGQRVSESVTAQKIRTALVVEDEPMVLRRLCQLVARRGYEVMSASTVAEGMARLADEPDLLITDLQLPDGSGEEIALASFEANPKRPIVVCSGFSADDVRRGRLRSAPLTFLAKPFTTADFESAIS